MQNKSWENVDGLFANAKRKDNGIRFFKIEINKLFVRREYFNELLANNDDNETTSIEVIQNDSNESITMGKLEMTIKKLKAGNSE